MKIVPKPWGKESILINTELYCGKIITCKENKWSSNGRWHYHISKDETFYILDGFLELDIKRRGTHEIETRILRKGETVRLYPQDRHRFKSENCRFLEISTMDCETDNYREELA